MPLVDLSLVTRALISVIQNGVAISDGWNGTMPNVTPAPPDRVTVDSLGFYLFHVSEDPHFKNTAPPAGSRVPSRNTAMGLQLYYQLTAHNLTDTDDAVLTAQQLLGCAVKVLHDYSIINDSTAVGSAHPLPDVGLDGAGNTLRIALQPVPSTDAVAYWTAGTGPTRLSAYYQVTAIQLEPEPIDSRSGRVLSYGVQLFQTGAPRLDGSRNTLRFVSGSGQPMSLELRPAQVPYDGTFQLTGLGLSGDGVALSLRSAAWNTAESVDGIAWGVAATSDQLIARVAATAGLHTILPGTYDAAVEVTRVTTTPAGPRPLTFKSNVVPIVVTPVVTTVTVTGPDALTVTGRLFQDAGLRPRTVEVYVESVHIVEDSDGIFDPGEFVVVSPTQIDVRVTPAVRRGVPVLVRVLVNGAESVPIWVTL